MSNPQFSLIYLLFVLGVLNTNALLTTDISKVVYAVNCGGEEVVDSTGIHYIKDTGFDQGIESDFGKEIKFVLTDDDVVYKTERYALESFSYKIPVVEDDSYVLILKFSEVWFQQPGEKVFDISLGDTTVIQNLDIFDKVGRYAAYDEFIPFIIRDGSLILSGKEIPDAYSAEDEELTINFLKKEFDNPKINAIVLVQGTLDDTHYAAHEYLMGEIARMKKEKREERKKAMTETSSSKKGRDSTLGVEDIEDSEESTESSRGYEEEKANWEYAKNIQSNETGEHDTIILDIEGEGGFFELMMSLPGFLIMVLLSVFSGSFYVIDKAERKARKAHKTH